MPPAQLNHTERKRSDSVGIVLTSCGETALGENQQTGNTFLYKNENHKHCLQMHSLLIS